MPKKSTPRKFAYIWQFQQIGINATKFEKTRIHFKIDVFTTLVVGDAKNKVEGWSFKIVHCGCSSFTKSFWKIKRIKSKWNTTFRVVSVENFRKQRYVWKGRPVFPVGIFQTEICVLFLQGHLWYQFQPFAAVFRGKWNWLEQMENSIPGRNLLVSKDSWNQNFAHYIAVCQCKW